MKKNIRNSHYNVVLICTSVLVTRNQIKRRSPYPKFDGGRFNLRFGYKVIMRKSGYFMYLGEQWWLMGKLGFSWLKLKLWASMILKKILFCSLSVRQKIWTHLRQVQKVRLKSVLLAVYKINR